MGIVWFSRTPEITLDSKYHFHWEHSDKFDNIDRGYSLEPPRRGGSNEYPQSMLRLECIYPEYIHSFLHVLYVSRMSELSTTLFHF